MTESPTPTQTAAAARPVLIALDLPLRTGDAAFTFSAGAALAMGAPICRGQGVVVPFGRRILPGIVLGEGVARAGLRPVLAAVGDAPLAPPSTVDLAEWVAREYLSSVGEALAVALPWDALWARVRVHAVGPIPPGVPSAARAALETIARRPSTVSRASRLLAAAGADATDAIAGTGMLAASLAPTREVVPRPVRGGQAAVWRAPESPDVPPIGSGLRRLEQAMADATAGGTRALLIAGSHRTAAYLAAIRKARAAGLSCVAAFASLGEASAFADAAAASGLAPVLLHAELPPAERLDAWRSLIDAPAVVVGTRGAAFAPVRDPILAIIDDEDSSGHKEERAPRYLTRVVAGARTRAAGMLIVGATTPTVAAYGGVQDASVRLIALPSPRPRIGVIDLRRRPDPDAAVSRPVLDAVRRAVRRRGRVILLTDRKGYAGGLHCGECGAVERCPRCGVAMRYERAGRRLSCRLCGRTQAAPAVCSRCGGRALMPLGAGSERIAAAVRRITPAVWRLDRDALTRDDDILKVLAPFRERGGILVATQLALPWIAALRPDLVAVVAADRLLHRPEFRASERALALLRTVSIASRSTLLVETADPEHPALRAAIAPSLRPFYAEELAQRASLGYPPARSLIVLTVAAPAASAADAIAGRLASAASPTLEVLGPVPLPAGSAPGGAAPAGHPRAGPARYEIVIKAADRDAGRALVAPLLIGTDIPRGVRIVADVDPHDL